MATRWPHDAVFAHNLAAHDLVHMALQGCDFAREFFDAVKRHHADFGIFQCHGVTSVVVIDDAIQAYHLAGHLKSRNLVAPVFCGHAGFEKTGANGIKRRERLTIAKQRAPTLDLAPCGHDVINAFELIVIEAQWHAKLSQITVGAGDFDGLWGHVGRHVSSIRLRVKRINGAKMKGHGSAVGG